MPGIPVKAPEQTQIAANTTMNSPGKEEKKMPVKGKQAPRGKQYVSGNRENEWDYVSYFPLKVNHNYLGFTIILFNTVFK